MKIAKKTTPHRKPRAVFVTGAAGFIGSSLCDQLLASQPDLHVIGVDNFFEYYPKYLKLENLNDLSKQSRFHFFEESFESKAVWNAANAQFQIEAVVHLAAHAGVRPSLEKPGMYYDNNVLKTLQLLENMRQSQVQNLVFTSSSSVYGGNETLPFREEHSTDKPISPYAATKKAGEEIIHTYCHLYGLKNISLRLFTVYGPRQRPDLAIRKFLLSVAREEPIMLFGNGTSSRDYTYVDDVVAAFIASIQTLQRFEPGRQEVMNIGSGRAIHLLSMVNAIERALGKKAIIELSEKHPADLEVTLADISKAQRILGYQPKVDFFDGVCHLRDWLFSDATLQRDLRPNGISAAVGDWLLVQRQYLTNSWHRLNRSSTRVQIP